MNNNLHISLTDLKNESRVLKETRSLVDHNIFDKVFIVGLHSDSLEYTERVHPRICLQRLNLRSRHLPKSLAFQSFKYVEYCIRIILNFRSQNIKTVNIHTLALLPLGVVLKFLFRASLVYDTHELETETNGMAGIRKRLAKLLEAGLIHQCDQVFVVSESIADWYALAYGIERPVVVLNSPKYSELTKKNLFREKLNILPNKLIFIYQGSFSPGRGIEIILEAFRSLESSDCVTLFMGYGPLEGLIKKEAAARTNIYYFPAVAPREVLDYTSSADVGLSIVQNTCLSYDYCMPNKQFEYIMAGLPIIVSNLKEMSQFTKAYGLGAVAEAETSESLLAAIKDLSGQKIETLRSKTKEASLLFSWDIQEKKMISSYHKLQTS